MKASRACPISRAQPSLLLSAAHSALQLLSTSSALSRTVQRGQTGRGRGEVLSLKRSLGGKRAVAVPQRLVYFEPRRLKLQVTGFASHTLADINAPKAITCVSTSAATSSSWSSFAYIAWLSCSSVGRFSGRSVARSVGARTAGAGRCACYPFCPTQNTRANDPPLQNTMTVDGFRYARYHDSHSFPCATAHERARVCKHTLSRWLWARR